MIPIALKAALGALSGVPRWVYLSVAAIAAVGLLWALHGHWEHKAHDAAFNEGVAKQKVLTDAEIAKNAINLKSIADLQAIVKADAAQSDARARAYADSKAQDAATIKEMDRREVGTDAARARLEAISRVPGGNEACRAPKVVSDALEGL